MEMPHQLYPKLQDLPHIKRVSILITSQTIEEMNVRVGLHCTYAHIDILGILEVG